jgi:hypothetical protein
MIQQSARYPMDSISLALSSNSMVARIVKRSLALIALTLATACKHDGKSEDLKSPAVDRFGDPAYEVVNVGTYNYTRNDIYDVYILQPGSDDIDRASRAVGGLAPDKDAVNWQGIGIMATLAWDWRWRTPKRFDLIWLNVFDRKAYESAANYNAYKSRETAPGSAWCRLDVTVNVPPERGKGNLFLLHFFPDGHVATSRVEEFPLPVADFANRDSLPVLRGTPCIHTVPNPKFGKQEPKFHE